MINTKIKLLTKEQLLISADRLTRFKIPEVKYLRVFKDVLIHNLITPKFNKFELDTMSYDELKNRAQEIINFSLDYLHIQNTKEINKKIFEYEKSVFKLDKNTEKLLANNINYTALCKLIDKEAPQNLLWIKNLASCEDIKEIRERESLHFPVEKLIIVEGATEETLLPSFGKLCEYDFDKNGVHLISAGGKNQVVKLFYEFAPILKIPIFVLLDKDGGTNAQEIIPKMRSIDKIHIINCGEFEDLLPPDLVKRSIKDELQNISIIEEKNLGTCSSRVKFLEDVFKTRGMHEFKKVEFSKAVKRNIQTRKDASSEIEAIISEIKEF